MTATETARTMRDIADAVERIGTSRLAAFPQPMLMGDAAIGAASLLCYIRDLVRATDKRTFNTEDVLVLLECISRDGTLFPAGTGVLMWEMEDEVPA